MARAREEVIAKISISGPVQASLFGTGEISPERAERYADQRLDVILHGICQRDGADT